MDRRAQAIFTVNDAAVNEQHPTQEVRVLLDGRPVARWTLGPASATPASIRVLLPDGALGACEPTTLAFEIAAPRTPIELGWSTWNTRPLGFRLARLRIAPAGRLQYRLGDAIDFFEGGDSLVFIGDALGTEWSLPDARGSWTLGRQASLRVPFEQPVSGDLPAAFVISGGMLSPSAPVLAVAVKANGQAVAEWVLDDRRVHRRFATIPAAVVAAAPELTLTFEIAEPRSPQSLGWSADSQPRGFRLARAVIGRSQVQIPRFKATGRDRPMYQRILGLPQYAVHVARILARRYLR